MKTVKSFWKVLSMATLMSLGLLVSMAAQGFAATGKGISTFDSGLSTQGKAYDYQGSGCQTCPPADASIEEGPLPDLDKARGKQGSGAGASSGSKNKSGKGLIISHQD